jgi:hypothetical protein
MPDADRPEPTETNGPETSSPSRWWFSAVPAVTFLVGLVLGGLVIGLGLSGEEGSTPGADSTPTPTNGEQPTPTSDVTVVVPNACLEAADTVEQAMDLIRDGVGSVSEFQPEELGEVLDQLEDLDARARELARQCAEVDVSRSP